MNRIRFPPSPADHRCAPRRKNDRPSDFDVRVDAAAPNRSNGSPERVRISLLGERCLVVIVPGAGEDVHTYRQPVKSRVRRKVLGHAVRLLTAHRSEAPIVRGGELEALAEYAMSALMKLGHRGGRRPLSQEIQKWIDWQSSRVQSRKPAELRVIYLCGPEPLNDLDVLVKLGVNPHNVWAVESNQSAFESAATSIASAGMPVKLHNGSLTTFFEQVQESFDIAYLDTTGPILGGKPAAIGPVLEFLRSSRLEPLSVLITNYAEVPDVEKDRYANVMTEFFRFRYNDVPRSVLSQNVDPAEAECDATHMLRVVLAELESVYSDFITRLHIDIARSWIPAARGLRIIERQYLSDKPLATAAIKAAFSLGKPDGDLHTVLKSMGDAILSPSSYPLISFLNGIKRLHPSEPLSQHLGNMSFWGRSAFDLNQSVALLDRIIEGHWSLASKELLNALVVPWFDRDNTFTCDLPLPNLMVHSLLGIYGRPYFASARDSIRGRYKAKNTTMFTDLFVLDQCRYFFDWFPTIDQVPSRFRSQAFQVVARCIMDRIWSADMSPDAHPYRGSSVAGFYDLPAAPFHSLCDRERWL